MKKSKIIYSCSSLTGVLLIAAALSKTLSVNNLVIAIRTGDVRQFADSILVNWIFSAVLLFLVGIWILFLSRDLHNFQRRAWRQAMIIGISLFLFGAGFWFKYPGSVHLPFFVLMGLVLLFPLIRYGGLFRN